MEQSNREIKRDNKIEEGLKYKGTDFWKGEIKKAGVEDKIEPFDYIVIEKIPPRSDSGCGEPVLKDVVINGKKTDVYRANLGENNEEHNVYLHVKE